jgi:hypothetical protein
LDRSSGLGIGCWLNEIRLFGFGGVGRVSKTRDALDFYCLRFSDERAEFGVVDYGGGLSHWPFLFCEENVFIYCMYY